MPKLAKYTCSCGDSLTLMTAEGPQASEHRLAVWQRDHDSCPARASVNYGGALDGNDINWKIDLVQI